jgi:hypothetical protein
METAVAQVQAACRCRPTDFLPAAASRARITASATRGWKMPGFRRLTKVLAMAAGLTGWGCGKPAAVALPPIAVPADLSPAPSERGTRPPVTAEPASGGGLEAMGAGTGGETNGFVGSAVTPGGVAGKSNAGVDGGGQHAP